MEESKNQTPAQDKEKTNDVAGWIKYNYENDKEKLSEKYKILNETYSECTKVVDNMKNLEKMEFDEGAEYELDGRIDGLTSVSTLRVPGLTIEKFKEFRKEAIRHIPECSSRMTA